jgi:hypothetical protein
MRVALLAALVVSTVSVPTLSSAQMEPDQLDPQALTNVVPTTHHSRLAELGGGVLGTRSTSGVLGVDSIPSFTSYFYRGDTASYFQFTWPYTMVGHTPLAQGDDSDWQGETTRINAPVIPVTVVLLDTDGTTRIVGGKPLVSTATQFVLPTLSSPVFSTTSYSSSRTPTQYTDAVHRAQFFNLADDDWHTLLRPMPTAALTMALPRGSYSFALNADGSCCKFILVDITAFSNALFPATAADTTTPIGNAENNGLIHTKDISTFLFNNVFLYFGTPNNCCVIGFHTDDVEPGTKANGMREKRYVVNYSSWVSPGIFRSTSFLDIAALSHELAETFADPFVNNATPFWLSPNGNCQNNLEVGDVIEGLPNANYAVTLNGATWHPQNEALLQWFAGSNPSNAIAGAFSYPDTSVLTSAAAVQAPNCP